MNISDNIPQGMNKQRYNYFSKTKAGGGWGAIPTDFFGFSHF